MFSCFKACGSCCGIFEHFSWRHFLGVFQALVALLAFSLSFGVYRPAGPITLHAIPAVHNSLWLLTFAVLSIACFSWAVVGVWQLSIIRLLERQPTFYRFWILFDLILGLASAGVVVAYIDVVLQNSDGCLDRSKQGCSAAWAFTVFVALWVLIEVVSFAFLIAKYIGRDESFERPDRKGEWKIWLRGAQVICATLSVTIAVFLYLPTGIPVVNGVRQPNVIWIFLLGAIICGIFWPWHLLMCFPWIQRSIYRSYGLYNFYLVMEVFALAAYLSLGAVYAWKFITKGSSCADIGQKGCIAVLATDAFTSIAGVMQIAQIIALILKFDQRPLKPMKPKKAKTPRQPKQTRQPRQPKQRRQPPAERTYSEVYPELQPPPPSYSFNEKRLDRQLDNTWDLDQIEREKWERDVQRRRAQAKARRAADKRAAEREREIRSLEKRRQKQEEDIRTLKDQARIREEHVKRLREDLWEQEESLEHEDDTRKREDEIALLRAKIRDQDEKLLQIKELQRQVGRGRRNPQDILPPPPLEAVLQGQRSRAPPDERWQESSGGATPLLEYTYRERERIRKQEERRAKLYSDSLDDHL